MGICLILGGLNPCQDGLGHLFRENGKENGKNGEMVKSRLKKSAPERPFECGGGGASLSKWVSGSGIDFGDSYRITELTSLFKMDPKIEISAPGSDNPGMVFSNIFT